ncbi:Crooked neck-like protein 1 [Kappamyces sp. JEL0680]|nr:Crooked neck-like protein 1 [Kappamyces sp. JEL0680]
MQSQVLRAARNKAPAAIQITAEQILRESKERIEPDKKQPRQRIADQEELLEYQLDKRRGFEDAGMALAGLTDRARSVFERALEHEHRSQTLWLKYTEMEMKHKNVNRARNIFDRVVAILPRVDVFWFKYTFMEEVLDNPAGARQVFERWMEWEPPEEAWLAYVKFEMRYKEKERARAVFRRFVTCFPQPKNWIKWSKFEEQNGSLGSGCPVLMVDAARQIYEQCIETLGDSFIDQNMYVSFAKFETRHKEVERARAIYKYALEKLPVGAKENLHNAYTLFEKQFGSLEGLEDVVISKRRLKYEEVCDRR